MKITRKIRQRAKEMFRECQVGGAFDDQRAQAMVQNIIQSRERNGLALLSYFHYLVKIDRDEHSALVESAVPLTEDLQARIREGLARNYNRKLETSFVANPALIGGLRIKVGSEVYDGSVEGRLKALEQSF